MIDLRKIQSKIMNLMAVSERPGSTSREIFEAFPIAVESRDNPQKIYRNLLRLLNQQVNDGFLRREELYPRREGCSFAYYLRGAA